jgi:hypothetical protein
VPDEFALFEQAADALRRALLATNKVERDSLLDEALRLHHLALAAAAPMNFAANDIAPPSTLKRVGR